MNGMIGGKRRAKVDQEEHPRPRPREAAFALPCLPPEKQTHAYTCMHSMREECLRGTIRETVPDQQVLHHFSIFASFLLPSLLLSIFIFAHTPHTLLPPYIKQLTHTRLLAEMKCCDGYATSVDQDRSIIPFRMHKQQLIARTAVRVSVPVLHVRCCAPRQLNSLSALTLPVSLSRSVCQPRDVMQCAVESERHSIRVLHTHTHLHTAPRRVRRRTLSDTSKM